MKMKEIEPSLPLTVLALDGRGRWRQMLPTKDMVKGATLIWESV